jgi:hypothetical protein
MSVTAVRDVVRYECDKHGPIGHEKSCPQCDLCEHGKMRSQHCEECAKDDSWATAPISDVELEQCEGWLRWGEGPTRRAPKPRVFSSVQLMRKLLIEYRALREAARKQAQTK